MKIHSTVTSWFIALRIISSTITSGSTPLRWKCRSKFIILCKLFLDMIISSYGIQESMMLFIFRAKNTEYIYNSSLIQNIYILYYIDLLHGYQYHQYQYYQYQGRFPMFHSGKVKNQQQGFICHWFCWLKSTTKLCCCFCCTLTYGTVHVVYQNSSLKPSLSLYCRTRKKPAQTIQ